MRQSLLLCIVGLGIYCPAYGESIPGCEGRIPDYVVQGSKEMVLTEDAEKILCRDDAGLEVWDGELKDKDIRSVVEDRIVPSALLAEKLGRGAMLEFRNCIFPEEVYFQGNLRGSASFDRCEFRGNLDIHNAQFEGEMRIDRSILHQGLHVADSVLVQPFRITGSILAGDLQVDESSFLGGIRFMGVRILGNLIANGLQSPVGISIEESRFLGSLNMTKLEVGGGVRFRECEWDERSLISFAKGTIAGGLRFDGCGFESNWGTESNDGAPLVRLTDITITSSMVLSDAKSKKFPIIRVSRCLIPFIKLPQWSIAEKMVLLNADELSSERDMEDSGELLQLVRKSYEAQGRTRDAVATRNAHRLMIARIKGQPVLGLRLALSYFGTGLWWFLGTVLAFTIILWVFGRRWHLVSEGDRAALVGYRALDLSLKSFFKGPPEEGELAARMAPEARKIMMLERLLGALFLFLLGFAMKEWFEW